MRVRVKVRVRVRVRVSVTLHVMDAVICVNMTLVLGAMMLLVCRVPPAEVVVVALTVAA